MGRNSNKDVLLESGFNVIWEKGYDAASVKDITDAAGLPKGSFYNYFESKEQFALEGLNFYLKNIIPMMDKSKPPKERLLLMMDYMEQKMKEFEYTRECFASTLGHAVTSQDPEFREAVQHCMQMMKQPFLDIFREMKEKGELAEDTDIEEIVYFFDMMIRGALFMSKVEKSDKPFIVFRKYLLKLINE